MAKGDRVYEVLDLDYNRLSSRDWVRVDSTCGETHVIPLKERRQNVAAISVADGVLRLFIDQDAEDSVIDISELRVGARCYTIRWAAFEEMRTAGLANGLIDEGDPGAPSAMVVHHEEIILLSDALKLMPLRALETLWHEACHVIEDAVGVGAEGGWPEAFVDAIAVQIVNILVQSGFIDLAKISIAGVRLFARQDSDKLR